MFNWLYPIELKRERNRYSCELFQLVSLRSAIRPLDRFEVTIFSCADLVTSSFFCECFRPRFCRPKLVGLHSSCGHDRFSVDRNKCLKNNNSRLPELTVERKNIFYGLIITHPAPCILNQGTENRNHWMFILCTISFQIKWKIKHNKWRYVSSYL